MIWPMTQPENLQNFLTIGELSRLTGITTHTLRMWEKRYGTPISSRLPSGHRRYPREEVPRLRAIARALESGYRASRVVPESLEKLQGLLGKNPLQSSGLKTSSENQSIIQQWLEAVREYDDQVLTHGFHQEWGKKGPLEFIIQFAVPFVQQVGMLWKSREIRVSQEHFASERLSDFLGGQWRRLNERKEGEKIILSTLPEEPHGLGLLMAAVVTSLTNFKIIYLGLNTPLKDIQATVDQSGAEILGLSISNSLPGSQIEKNITQLRKDLPRKIQIVLGGQGAPSSIPGTIGLKSFSEYYSWLQDLKNP